LTDEERSRAARIGAAARNADREPGRGQLAARHASHHGVTLSAAARLFGVSVATVSDAWARLYPGRSACVSRRGPEPAPVEKVCPVETQPMTAEQVADLVERARCADAEVARRRADGPRMADGRWGRP
jgi:hypothetical protein